MTALCCFCYRSKCDHSFSILCFSGLDDSKSFDTSRFPHPLPTRSPGATGVFAVVRTVFYELRSSNSGWEVTARAACYP